MKNGTQPKKKTSAERSRDYRQRKRQQFDQLLERDRARDPRTSNESPTVATEDLAGPPAEGKLIALPAPRETRPLERGGSPTRYVQIPPLEPAPPAPADAAQVPPADAPTPQPEGIAPAAPSSSSLPGASVLDGPAPPAPPPSAQQKMIAFGLTQLVSMGTRIAIARAGVDGLVLPLEVTIAAKELGMDLSSSRNLGDAGAQLVGAFYYEHALRAIQKVPLLNKQLPYQDEVVTVGGALGSVAIIYADAKKKAEEAKAAGKAAPASPFAAAAAARKAELEQRDAEDLALYAEIEKEDAGVNARRAAAAAGGGDQVEASPATSSAWGELAGEMKVPTDASAADFAELAGDEGGLDAGS